MWAILGKCLETGSGSRFSWYLGLWNRGFELVSSLSPLPRRGEGKTLRIFGVCKRNL